ncbi:MAG: hypothetical protein NXH75_03545 [Halobacteriovoraceae bacterium]|nr:hypothetical protein [Halobacteriovoraceae bacterium]
MKLLQPLSRWLLLAMVFALPHSLAHADQSYSELGRETVRTYFIAVKGDLETFSFNTDWKSTKKIRKDIGNLKLLLDVFAHIYPKKGLGVRDSWAYLRERLDKGYEIFGNYKDVYDTSQTTGEEINSEEKDKLFEYASEWRNDFLENVAHEEIFFYLEEVTDQFTRRKKKDLPKYIWRRLDFSPKREVTGIKNLQKLIGGLLELGEDDLEELYDIKKLTKYKNEETFHDWRKGLRNVLKLHAFFPGVREILVNSREDLNTLELAIDKFGDLNDLLVVYHKKGSNKIKKQVNKEWKVLKEWLKNQEMAEVLSNLSDAISP